MNIMISNKHQYNLKSIKKSTQQKQQINLLLRYFINRLLTSRVPATTFDEELVGHHHIRPTNQNPMPRQVAPQKNKATAKERAACADPGEYFDTFSNFFENTFHWASRIHPIYIKATENDNNCGRTLL